MEIPPQALDYLPKVASDDEDYVNPHVSVSRKVMRKKQKAADELKKAETGISEVQAQLNAANRRIAELTNSNSTAAATAKPPTLKKAPNKITPPIVNPVSKSNRAKSCSDSEDSEYEDIVSTSEVDADPMEQTLTEANTVFPKERLVSIL